MNHTRLSDGAFKALCEKPQVWSFIYLSGHLEVSLGEPACTK